MSYMHKRKIQEEKEMKKQAIKTKHKTIKT